MNYSTLTTASKDIARHCSLRSALWVCGGVAAAQLLTLLCPRYVLNDFLGRYEFLPRKLDRPRTLLEIFLEGKTENFKKPSQYNSTIANSKHQGAAGIAWNLGNATQRAKAIIKFYRDIWSDTIAIKT